MPVQDEQAYASVVQAAGHGSLLRELFVHRANHCSFTAAETITAFQTLVQRLDSGTWQHSDDARSLPPPCLSRSPPRNLHNENQKTVYPPSVL